MPLHTVSALQIQARLEIPTLTSQVVLHDGVTVSDVDRSVTLMYLSALG